MPGMTSHCLLPHHSLCIGGGPTLVSHHSGVMTAAELCMRRDELAGDRVRHDGRPARRGVAHPGAGGRDRAGAQPQPAEPEGHRAGEASPSCTGLCAPCMRMQPSVTGEWDPECAMWQPAGLPCTIRSMRRPPEAWNWSGRPCAMEACLGRA